MAILISISGMSAKFRLVSTLFMPLLMTEIVHLSITQTMPFSLVMVADNLTWYLKPLNQKMKASVINVP